MLQKMSVTALRLELIKDFVFIGNQKGEGWRFAVKELFKSNPELAAGNEAANGICTPSWLLVYPTIHTVGGCT